MIYKFLPRNENINNLINKIMKCIVSTRTKVLKQKKKEKKMEMNPLSINF